MPQELPGIDPGKPKAKLVTNSRNDFVKNDSDKPAQVLKIGCWNIRRGLIKRELELCVILKTEKINIKILTETDSNMIKTKDDYRIEGYETVIQLRKDDIDKTRIITNLTILTNMSQCRG